MPDRTHTLDDYITHIGDAVSRGASKSETVASVKRVLTRALETPGWLPARCRRPDPECYARHLLHEDPSGRFTIVVMVWQKGQRTPIHDHGGVWCVEGVYEGRIQVDRYELDEPVAGDVAHFHDFEHIEAGIGETGALIPPVDYHTITNPFEPLAVTVHTYGGAMKSCRVYLPRPDGAFEVRTKDLSYTSRPGPYAAGAPAHG